MKWPYSIQIFQVAIFLRKWRERWNEVEWLNLCLGEYYAYDVASSIKLKKIIHNM